MELVLTRLSPKTQVILNIITSLLGAIVCLVAAWYGIQATWDNFQVGSMFGTLLWTPKFIIMAIIPVGYSLLFIQFLRRSYGYFGKWNEKKS